MTSPPPLPGEESGPEQEAIWDDSAAPGGGSDPAERDAAAEAAGSATRGIAGSLTSTARTPGPAGLFYADVPNRVIAMIIDIIVLAIIGLLLAVLLGGLVTEPGSLDSGGGDLDVVPFLVVLVLQLAISFAYFGYSWTALRGTPGMRLLGMQIGDETDGHSISWRQAGIRWLIIGIPSMLGSLGGYVPSVIGVALTVIGFAWLAVLLYSIAQSPTKQGIHDRYAHTIMVKAGRRVS